MSLGKRTRRLSLGTASISLGSRLKTSNGQRNPLYKPPGTPAHTSANPEIEEVTEEAADVETKMSDLFNTKKKDVTLSHLAEPESEELPDWRKGRPIVDDQLETLYSSPFETFPIFRGSSLVSMLGEKRHQVIIVL